MSQPTNPFSDAYSILNESDEDFRNNANNYMPAEWVNARDVKYQSLVVTRCNIVTKRNEERDRDETYAYVNFYFEDDEDKTAYVFRTWEPGMVSQVRRLISAGHWPLRLGIADVLTAEPYISKASGEAYYPLRFVTPEQLAILNEGDTNDEIPSQEATTGVSGVSGMAPNPSAKPATPRSAPTSTKTASPKKPFGTRGN